ncbi:MAG: tRNA (adenosine(37)-N6)-threonylcarbamoyltransferase complex dimerization subunit type 1 TsaB [Clostridia bacterium]|nr:tRNA (adenosine(37)-N6)-threonylcarbamoyltransferase complex dimerization subunit type 1 TsaB [Clostridia bacterium]
MLTLAVDTSSLTASCALVENGKVVSELSTQHGKTHSQKLVPMIQTLLRMVDCDLRDVNLFAAAIGPGSFTGLRIGVVTIKGLAYSLKKPVCGIPTLDALAYSLPDYEGLICPMLDARNNQVFTSVYDKKQNSFDKLTPDYGLTIDELVDTLNSYKRDVMILGDATPLHYDRLKSTLGSRVVEASPSLFYPRASSTGLLAEKAYKDNKAVSAFELEPLYLRKSQAERLKDLKSQA